MKVIVFIKNPNKYVYTKGAISFGRPVHFCFDGVRNSHIQECNKYEAPVTIWRRQCGFYPISLDVFSSTWLNGMKNLLFIALPKHKLHQSFAQTQPPTLTTFSSARRLIIKIRIGRRQQIVRHRHGQKNPSGTNQIKKIKKPIKS